MSGKIGTYVKPSKGAVKRALKKLRKVVDNDDSENERELWRIRSDLTTIAVAAHHKMIRVKNG